MNDYVETEQAIDLKDLLYRTVKQWRAIIIGAVIIGILGGAYQLYAGLRVQMDNKQVLEVREKYEIALDDYNATGERLKKSIEDLREQSARQQEYNDNSELMKIDPMNKWEGNLQLYIDSKYQVNPGMSFQNTDPTNRLVSAYTSYLQSGELYSDLISASEVFDEIRFLTEAYGIGANSGAATISVWCVGKNEEDVRTLLGLVKQKIDECHEDLKEAIGDHDLWILTESYYSTIDLDLDAKQKANQTAISDFANEIAEQKEKLTKWENTPQPRMEYGGKYILKNVIKYMIIGGIIGFLVMACLLAARYVLRRTMKTTNDWKCLGISVLGQIRRAKKERPFRRIDNLVERVFGCQTIALEEVDCTLAAHNLAAIAQKQGITEVRFIGQMERVFAESLVKKMSAAVPETAFSYAGDVLSEPDAIGCLKGAEQVVLLAENQTTSIADARQTLTLLKAMGITALGVVTIE